MTAYTSQRPRVKKMLPYISVPLPPSRQKPVSKVKFPSLGITHHAQWEQLRQWKQLVQLISSGHR